MPWIEQADCRGRCTCYKKSLWIRNWFLDGATALCFVWPLLTQHVLSLLFVPILLQQFRASDPSDTSLSLPLAMSMPQARKGTKSKGSIRKLPKGTKSKGVKFAHSPIFAPSADPTKLKSFWPTESSCSRVAMAPQTNLLEPIITGQLLCHRAVKW